MNSKKIEINHPETWGTWTVGEELLEGVYAITEDARDFYGTVTVQADGRLVVHSNALNILTDAVTVVEPAPTPEVETVGPYALGDVLVSSWGYEQTNIDFYQVIGFTKSRKSVRLIAIEADVQPREGSFMTCDCTPLPGCPVPHAKSFTKRINPDRDYIALTSYSFARKVDRKTYTSTHYA